VVDHGTKSAHGNLPFDIDAEHLQRLSELAASLGVTLSDILLAAVVIALQRELKTHDICLRHVLHGRDEPQLFDMIGHTIDPVILRIRLNPQSHLRDVAQQIHRVSVEAIANQVPCYYVDKILNESGATALVQTNFQLRETAGGLMRETAPAFTSGQNVSIWNPEITLSTPRNLQAHDINLSVVGGTVRGRIAYLESVYDDETIKRFIEGLHLAWAH
jgi:non-ribosomal peptide synthetase component F